MVNNQEMDTNQIGNSVNLNNNSKEENNVNRDFNPSILGREFVRQYYTMLNEGPQNLFRFYSSNSSLIHGNAPGEQVQASYGQAEINKKLMSLNFRDCHTKIRQVDSLESTSRNVVIQVIGELSNNGEPMRRFFQTFILAPRSPTHYYVRNDIFRYQDEVFVDDDEGYTEENCEDPPNHLNDNTIDAGDNTSTVLNSSLVNSQPPQQPKIGGTEKLNGQLSEQEKINNDLERNKFSCMNPEISPINLVSSTASTTNELNNSSSEQSIDSKQSSINNDKQLKDAFDEEEQKIDNEASLTSGAAPTPVASAPIEQQTAPIASVLVQPTVPPQEKPDEPRTYATMVQRKFGQLSTNNTNSTTTNNLDKNDNLVLGNNLTGLNKKDDFTSDWLFENAATTTVANNEPAHETVANDKDKRNGREHSDEQQVFVGNLPQNIDENQLREYFNEYGDIVDVRICQKQGKTPNYGFITFNEAIVVKKILSKKPIYFNNHRINVEEKRSQSSRGSGNFNRNSSSVNSLNSNNRNFSSNATGSAFGGGSRLRDERRGFNNDKRKGTGLNSATNSTSATGNRNQNNNFRR